MPFWSKLFTENLTVNTQKIRRLSSDNQSLVESYLKAGQIARSDKLSEADLIAVDFETTGLTVKSDEIISMGFCPMAPNHIQLSKCEHIVCNSQQALTSDNVAVHGLTDDTVSQGISGEQALMKFLTFTKGKIIVAHYHSIERSFIQALAVKILGRPIPLNIIDTYIIAKERMQRRNQVIGTNSLRLFNLRKQLGLPNYNAHNALEDAISTAELLMAQVVSFNMPLESISLGRLGLASYKN